MELTPGLRRDLAPDLEAVGEDEDLVARIRDEIRAGGPMPFVRFMDLALYDPAGGYYRGPDARAGRTGDFLTAPEAHPIFGRAVARVLDETWHRLGEPARFVVREYGAGDGTLALAILDGLRRDGSGLERAIAYDPIEVEPRRVEAIASRLAEAGWAGTLVEPDTTAEPIVGVILGNEVLDALPVHRVRRRDGALVEIAVGLEGDRLVEVEIEPTTPALAERLADEAIELVDGQTAEICLALDGWVGDTAAGLARGLVLLIDYGSSGDRALRPRSAAGRHAAGVRPPSCPRRPVPARRPPGPHRPCRRERGGTGGGRRGPRAPRHADAGGVPRRGRHRRAPASHPVRPRDVTGVVPRGPLGADAPARSGRDGPVPGHGVRARLARRSAVGRVRLPPAGTPAPLLVGNADGIAADDHTGLGRCTYCRPSTPARTLRDGRARPDGERRANLHARSARAAPRRVLHGHQALSAGPRRQLPDPHRPAASTRLPLVE